MGGFMLYENNKPKKVLEYEDLTNFHGLYHQGRIEFPTVTEDDIKDRSKADALSKGMVLGQTTWFIAQCISRRIQGFEITELELVTVAFAFLNAFIYFLWWNKPLNAEIPVAIHMSKVTKTKRRDNNTSIPIAPALPSSGETFLHTLPKYSGGFNVY